MHKLIILLSFCFLSFSSCYSKANETSIKEEVITDKEILVNENTIHIIVALCDNKYQGIVPVPNSIGNGQDPKNNLYWGTAYGIKTYFNRSAEWKPIKTIKIDSLILERVVYKHKTKDFYLVADAYNGKYIKQATEDFLNSSSGNKKEIIEVDGKSIGINGHAKLLSYIGHDGLMDFKIAEEFINTDTIKRDVIILACYSHHFFQPKLKDANVNLLLTTSGLMAPEAYTIHDAISGYLLKETNAQIELRAAKAYSKYQKCSLKAAQNLFITQN